MVITLDGLPELPIDPQALAAQVARLRSSAAAVDAASTDVSNAWNGLPGAVEAPSTGELLAQMQTVSEAMTTTVEMSSKVADILDHAAEQLLRLKQQRDELAGEVEAHQRMVAALDVDEASPGAGTDLQEQSQHLSRQIDTVVEEARADLARLGVPPWAVARFGESPVALGPRVPFATAADRFRDDTSLVYLAALAAGDSRHVEDLLRRHPEWALLLQTNPPSADAVRHWWDALDDRAREALRNGAPVLIGALGGVPPLDRVAANRLNARRRRAEALREIARYEAVAAEGAAVTLRTERRRAVADLRDEIAYLDRVEAGEVQLFLFQPEDDRIVEMIGSPGPDTSRVLTYVPGTFTTRHSFYRNEVQQVAEWMVGRGAADVAFVWKGTEFPGDDENGGATEQVGGLLEANEQERAAPAASRLAEFQRELESDPSLEAARQIGMGHSWGLVPLTGSEAAGVHYDQVHSLAGAWVPRDWTAGSETRYFHWSYTDALSALQDVGLVGEGRNPDVTPAFESHIFERDDDFLVTVTDSPIAVPLNGSPDGPFALRLNADGFGTHNLIASDDDGNREALAEIRKAIRQ